MHVRHIFINFTQDYPLAVSQYVYYLETSLTEVTMVMNGKINDYKCITDICS